MELHVLRRASTLALGLAAVSLGLTACGSTGDSTRANAAVAIEKTTYPEEAGTQSPPAGIAAQPYTAAHIRAAHPVGTFTTYRVSAASKPTLVQRTEWVECDAERCVMSSTTEPAVGAAQRAEATWVELRDHASFPLATTKITRGSVEVEAGKFRCMHYAVVLPKTETEEGGTQHYWFDTESAGSPVLYTQELDGEELFRMELLSTNRR